jgi:hypothetical protein
MGPQNPQTPQKPAKSYGKRPIWQWVVIYLILAIIIVYGLIYLIFMRGSGGSSSY